MTTPTDPSFPRTSFPVLTPDEAAALITHGQTIGFQRLHCRPVPPRSRPKALAPARARNTRPAALQGRGRHGASTAIPSTANWPGLTPFPGAHHTRATSRLRESIQCRQDPLFRHAPFPLGPAGALRIPRSVRLGGGRGLRCHARRADRAHDLGAELRPRSFAAPRKSHHRAEPLSIRRGLLGFHDIYEPLIRHGASRSILRRSGPHRATRGQIDPAKIPGWSRATCPTK